MRKRFRQPMALVALAAVLVLVPAILWLVLAWETRPYSAQEIEADRVRVEASSAYMAGVRECLNANTGVLAPNLLTGSPNCWESTYRALSTLDREALAVEDVGGWGRVMLLAMAATILVAAALAPPVRGVGTFARRLTHVFVVATVVTAVTGALWWWGIAWLAERRGLDHDVAWWTIRLVRRGALLAGLAGVIGTSLAVLVRHPTRAVVTVAAVAVATGLVLLSAPTTFAPWLPALNVTAWLDGGAEYLGPESAERCVPVDEYRTPLLGLDNAYVIHGGGEACSRWVTHTSGEALVYLVSLTAALAMAAAVTARRADRPRE